MVTSSYNITRYNNILFVIENLFLCILNLEKIKALNPIPPLDQNQDIDALVLWITEHIDNYIITGSTSLYIRGLLDKDKIRDIDVLLKDTANYDKLKNYQAGDYELVAPDLPYEIVRWGSREVNCVTYKYILYKYMISLIKASFLFDLAYIVKYINRIKLLLRAIFNKNNTKIIFWNDELNQEDKSRKLFFEKI